MKLRIHRIAICLLATTLAVLGQQPNSDSRLLQQIREGNAGEVQKLLRSGDSPNVRDATGATALMTAAAFGPNRPWARAPHFALRCPNRARREPKRWRSRRRARFARRRPRPAKAWVSAPAA